VIAGAFLLVLPGFLTDILAFIFIIPPTRRYFAARVNPNFRKKMEDLVEKKRREFLSRQNTKPHTA
ncbi:MAG TPA: FxsA family protein, partial [Candidatus Omnitrophota bacterium]|nr:FxsA family protein [Candidatus Omnitrophota bacterium]